MTDKIQVKDSHILCYNYGAACMNNAVGEADMGDGRGVKFYCRKCVLGDRLCEIEDMDADDTLIFCQREWDEQK